MPSAPLLRAREYFLSISRRIKETERFLLFPNKLNALSSGFNVHVVFFPFFESTAKSSFQSIRTIVSSIDKNSILTILGYLYRTYTRAPALRRLYIYVYIAVCVRACPWRKRVLPLEKYGQWFNYREAKLSKYHAQFLSFFIKRQTTFFPSLSFFPFSTKSARRVRRRRRRDDDGWQCASLPATQRGTASDKRVIRLPRKIIAVEKTFWLFESRNIVNASEREISSRRIEQEPLRSLRRTTEARSISRKFDFGDGCLPTGVRTFPTSTEFDGSLDIRIIQPLGETIRLITNFLLGATL